MPLRSSIRYFIRAVYGSLVVPASGAAVTPGVREHAISLDTATQAKRFHGRLVNAYIRGHAQPLPLRSEQLQVAIIGAGATGTELAAELHYTGKPMKRREFVTLLGGAAAWPATGWGQEAKLPTIPRIGSLMFGPAAASAGRVEVLGAALHELWLRRRQKHCHGDDVGGNRR